MRSDCPAVVETRRLPALGLALAALALAVVGLGSAGGPGSLEGSVLAAVVASCGWPLVVRTGKHELLDNEVRAALLERVREDAGVHLQDLVRHGGAGNGAVRYHLRELDDAGLVERVKIGGYVRFFPPHVSREERVKIATLRAGCNRQVHRLLQEDPKSSVRDLADEVDRSPSTVLRALEMLRDAGLAPDT